MTTSVVPSLPAAYGFRLEGVGPTPWLAVTGAEHWPVFQIAREPGGPELTPLAAHPLAPAATICDEITTAQLVHPGLGRLMFRAAIRNGMEAVHAGALLGERGAWIVCGSKFAGKSTLLGQAAGRHLRVLADDIVFLRDGTCFASPRCVDLRPGAAAHLRVAGTAVRPDDPRVRVGLPAEEAEHPIAGFVFLAWDEGPASLRRISTTEGLKRLIRRPENEHFPRDPVALLDLAALPSYELSRPRRWSSIHPSLEAMRTELALTATHEQEAA